MTTTPADLTALLAGDSIPNSIGQCWHRWNTQRIPIREEWNEVRDYVFATDTSKTSQGENGWKNSTTIPKLTQIRDNLHSNYETALFSTDHWMNWLADKSEEKMAEKAEAILAYMKTKTRDGPFRSVINRLLLDYIDYGMAFGTVKYVNQTYTSPTGDFTKFVGPVPVRISPYDIVFNPAAESFEDSPKIIRSIKSMGEMAAMAEEEPSNRMLAETVLKGREIRQLTQSFSQDDWEKLSAYTIDGFGNLKEYYQSGYVELLHFYGDWYDEATGVLQRNKRITVMDRAHVVRNDDNPNWLGCEPIYAVGWRDRPDNLWSMGPLANLVGMQYRIDHIENSKADAFDLGIHSPLAIIGEVEEFDWGPGCEVHLDEGGSVSEIQRNIQFILQADTGIARLEQLMELMAGAPREAMGIRSPGEKTAFEVDRLEAASGRIFNTKIRNFEIGMVEKLLNGMLESARRNLDTNDVVSIMDDDLGVQKFIAVTKQDITASGKLRPVGARHFASQALLMTNLSQLFGSPIGEMMRPHTSGKQMTKLVEETMNLEGRNLFSPNVAVFEQQETQRLVTQTEEDAVAEDGVGMGAA